MVLDEAQIKRFAGEFDPQPFHLDEVAAKATVFDGLAAREGLNKELRLDLCH